MIKFAPYITIYDLNEFQDIVDEVIWVFSKNLKNVSRANQRFNIHVVQNEDSERIHSEGSIISIWKYFPESDQKAKTLLERKSALLNFITTCFTAVSTLKNWSLEAILKAETTSISEGINFKYNSKPKLNSNKTISASLELTLKGKLASISVLFNHKTNGKTKRIHLIDTLYDNISWGSEFDKPNWLDDTKFGFVFKNGLTLTSTIEGGCGEWSELKNKMDQYFHMMMTRQDFEKQVDYAKWANW